MADAPHRSETPAADWREVLWTDCRLVSASTIDRQLGWVREEFQSRGVEYTHFRSDGKHDWYPHYTQSLDNMVRFGGLFVSIHVHADLRRTRLLGATHVHEGGCMLVRARDDVYRMADLRGKRVGLTRSLNKRKCDWWRAQEEQGIELLLRVNGMSREDVEIVEYPYADDWYDKPDVAVPEDDTDGTMLRAALLEGAVDAIYTQSKVFQHLHEATGKLKAIDDLSRYPDWTLQSCNVPAAMTCTDVMADRHPELVVAYVSAMTRVGRWANEHKRAAAALLNERTDYLDVEDTYRGIRDVDLVPNLSPQNLAAIEIAKDFLLTHGYIRHDFDVREWAAPEFLEESVAQRPASNEATVPGAS